jgi:hypothetical protein
MDADSDADVLVMRRERQRLLARRDILRRGEDSFDARLARTVQYFGDVGCEAAIGEMRMCVDHAIYAAVVRSSRGKSGAPTCTGVPFARTPHLATSDQRLALAAETPSCSVMRSATFGM